MRELGCLMLVAMLAGCVPPGPKRLSGIRNAVSPEGWRGKQYFENRRKVSEEFDAVGNDGRIDLWRFFDEGRLLSEERDRNADDLIDCRAFYSPASGELREFRRDEDFDGEMDLRVQYLGGYRWQQTWDRNQDGTADFLLSLRGPARLLSELGVDPAEAGDLREVAPPNHWHELYVNTDLDGRLDAWTRFRDGQPAERGIDPDGDGRPERWVRIETPAPPAEAAAPPEDRAQPTGTSESGYTGITDVRPAPDGREGPPDAYSEPAPAVERPARSAPPPPPARPRADSTAGAVPAKAWKDAPQPEENLAPQVRVRVRLKRTEAEATPTTEPEKTTADAPEPADARKEPESAPPSVRRRRPYRHPSADLEE